MTTVAVVGASGLLGRAVSNEIAQTTNWRLVRTAYRRSGPGYERLDVRDPVAIARFVSITRPDVIIITAAERHPDVCESDPRHAHALNVDAVRAIARAAKSCNAWVMSVSTDYVFDGTQAPYRHDAAPCPLNAYGRSKLAGEHALLDEAGSGCILRLPLLYGFVEHYAESAVTSLILAIVEAARSGRAARMDAWAIRYPTFTGDTAKVIRQMIEAHLNGVDLSGIVHWSAAAPMTKYEIALSLASLMNLPANLIADAEPHLSTPRPRDCHLDSSRLELLGIGERSDFALSMREILRHSNLTCKL